MINCKKNIYSLPAQEQSAIHQLRTDLRDALLEAEAIRKGQQEGTTWRAFLAELDRESEEMEATNGLIHYQNKKAFA